MQADLSSVLIYIWTTSYFETQNQFSEIEKKGKLVFTCLKTELNNNIF